MVELKNMDDGGGNELFSFATKSLVVINHLDILFQKCRDKEFIVERDEEERKNDKNLGRWRYVVKEEEEREREREEKMMKEKREAYQYWQEKTREEAGQEMLSAFYAQALASSQGNSLDSSVNFSSYAFQGGFAEAADKKLSCEFPDDYKTGRLRNGVKLRILFELLKRAVENSEKTLVFSKSLTTLDCLEKLLKRHEVPRRKNKGSNGGDEEKSRKKRKWSKG